MKGRVLGYTNQTLEGAIKAKDGNRYSFTQKEWKSDSVIRKDIPVDFVINGKMATEIYPLRDHYTENTRIFLGIISLIITLLLGFVGTFISRLLISKQSFSRVIIPTLLHGALASLIFIPAIGWVIYLLCTGYFMAKNYQFT